MKIAITRFDKWTITRKNNYGGSITMYRLCFGTVMTILYQARNQKVTNASICDAFFKCFGKSIDSYDASTSGHLKSGKINVPPDVIDAARKSNADEVDSAVQKYVIPLIKMSHHQAVVRAIKAVIRDDSYIINDTVVGYCTGYEKKNLLESQVFCLASLLASVLYYVCVEVKNNECATAIKALPKEYVKGFETGETIRFEGSEAKPKPKLTLTLQDPTFNNVFDKVTTLMVQMPGGLAEIEIYKVSDVTNRQLRFRKMQEYLTDHIGEYVFSRAKASRYEKSNRVPAIGTHALIQFLKAYGRSKDTLLGEILLYIFMEQGLNAPKIISKIEIDDNGFLNSKSDGIHLLMAGNGGVPYDQLIFGASNMQGEIDAAVDVAFEKIIEIIDNDNEELQTIEKTCHSDIYDDITRDYMVDLILNGRGKPDMAFGVFLGYTISLSGLGADPQKYREAIEKQLQDDLNKVQPYIVKKIADEGLSGYNFYFYVIPFNNADIEKTEIIDSMIGGV